MCVMSKNYKCYLDNKRKLNIKSPLSSYMKEGEVS